MGCVMRSVYEQRLAEQNEIKRQIWQGAAKFGSRSKIEHWSKELWETKAAANMATQFSTSERTAARWLSGELSPPGKVVWELSELIKQKVLKDLLSE